MTIPPGGLKSFGMKRIPCSACDGIVIRHGADSVFGMRRNRRSACGGLVIRHGAESAFGIERNTQQVKILHDYQCQVCSMRLETAAGPYADGVHIRPLGLPHYGPDDLSNLLCLCPNHRVQFRSGFIAVRDDFSLLGTGGRLRTVPKHRIGKEFLAYHREHYAQHA